MLVQCQHSDEIQVGKGRFEMTQDTSENLVLGAIYLVSELLLSFIIVSLVKILEPTMAVFEIIFYRYLLCLPLLILYGRWSLGAQFLRINNTFILVLRSIFGFMGLSFWFLAIMHIDISLATALANTMPIFITILSILIGKENVGTRRIIAVLCGFVGVMVLLLPMNAEVSMIGTLYALSGAFFAGLMFVYIRMLGKSDATISTAIWYNSGGAVFSALLWAVLPDQSRTEIPIEMGLSPLAILVFIGVLASFQQFFLAQSHRYAEASALAPLHYIAIPMGVMVGVVLFDEVITGKFIVGSLIIVGVNYYIFLRERAATRKHSA